jgi:hypothetical protein
LEIDWSLVLNIGMPVAMLFLGVAIDRLWADKPKLVSHLGFISSHNVKSSDPDRPDTQVNTHSVILRNTGRKTATNVRLGHTFLPDIKIYPDIEYFINDLPGGGKEIVFPSIVPKKEVTISYLYFPPDLWNQINTHTESDEGPAKVVNVLLQAQLKPWQNRVIVGILGLGCISAIYIIIQLAQWLMV